LNDSVPDLIGDVSTREAHMEGEWPARIRRRFWLPSICNSSTYRRCLAVIMSVLTRTLRTPPAKARL
jgi:hypothetical protein